MTKYKVGKIVRGTVTGVESYGVFVSLDEFFSGLIHISEISNTYIKDPNDYVKIGDIINVEIKEVDEEQSQLKLSIKDINYNKNNKYKTNTIRETKLGFRTLEYKLSYWIEENIKKQTKTKKVIDKNN